MKSCSPDFMMHNCVTTMSMLPTANLCSGPARAAARPPSASRLETSLAESVSVGRGATTTRAPAEAAATQAGELPRPCHGRLARVRDQRVRQARVLQAASSSATLQATAVERAIRVPTARLPRCSATTPLAPLPPPPDPLFAARRLCAAMAHREEPSYTSTSPAEESDTPLAAPVEPEPQSLPGLGGAPVRCECARRTRRPCGRVRRSAHASRAPPVTQGSM